MPYRGFEFSCKTQFIFTEDAEQALKKQLLRLKPHKLFVVASQSRFRLISGVLKELGCPYVLQTGCMGRADCRGVLRLYIGRWGRQRD